MIQKHISTAAITIDVVLSAMGTINYGYCLSYYGSTQNSIIQLLGYQNYAGKTSINGLINALLPIGGAFGAFGSTTLAQKFGLRKSFIICDIFGILIVIASLFLNYWTITMTRFLFGVIVGCNSALVPQYINQIAPKSLSGILGSLCTVSILLGFTTAYTFEWLLLQNKPTVYDPGKYYGLYGFNSWRIIFAFPAVCYLIRLFAFGLYYTDDLPSELLQRGDSDKAKQILSKQYKQQYQLEKIQELEQDLELEGSKNITYSDLKGKLYRKRIQIGIVLSIMNQWSGINAVCFYSYIVFNQVTNYNSTKVQTLTIGDGIISLLSSIACGFIIDKFGRRLMYLVGNGVCFIALITLTSLYMKLELYEDTMAIEDRDSLQKCIIVTIYTFILVFSMSIGPVFWVYISELLPPKGIGLVVVLNWLSLALLAQFFPIVAAEAQVFVCYGFFAFISLVGEVFIYYEVKETQSLTKTQIQNIFIADPKQISTETTAGDWNVFKDDLSPCGG